jgi:hypothetical protein
LSETLISALFFILLYSFTMVVFLPSDSDFSPADKDDRPRQELPLGLPHHPLLKLLRRIGIPDLHRLLQQHGAAVRNLAHEMHRRARNLDAVLERLFMDPQAVEAVPAEGRNEGRMHVDDFIGKARITSAREYAESRQHHKPGLRLPQAERRARSKAA